MPKRNRKMENFFHVFTYDEAAELVQRLDNSGYNRNFKDSVVLANVCASIAQELRHETGDPRWSEDNVKKFVANNVRLFPMFVDYVNNNVGLKYNKAKNRIHVSVEYWHFIGKENEHQVLFRESGYPFYETWSIIHSYHQPAEVVMDPVGSSPASPILVKDEPFDPEATDRWDVQFPSTPRRMSIKDSKLCTL